MMTVNNNFYQYFLLKSRYLSMYGENQVGAKVSKDILNNTV